MHIAEAKFWSRWMLLAALPGVANAHPVDEVIQGAYLMIAPGELRLELDLTPGTEVVDAVVRSLDTNADHRITDQEARSYAQVVLAQATLTLDGTTAPWALDRISVPPRENLERGDIIKIFAVAKRPDIGGTHVLSFRNDYQPAKSTRTANVFLQPGAGWQYQVAGQQRTSDGQQLTVTYAVTRP